MDLNSSDRFEIICRYKDSKPSNLNKVFEKYGTSTLEAKVPVVDDKNLREIQDLNKDDQTMATLALKSQAGSDAIEGRKPRTKDRQVNLVGVGNNIFIAAGRERERTPVDEDELDEDLDEYMKITAKLRAEKKKLSINNV